MKVTLWLTVAETTWAGPDELWTRSLWTDQAPAAGETVILWPGEEDDPGDGPMWTVDRRWWNADGAIECQLTRMIVDPPEDERQRLMADAAGPRRYEAKPWWSNPDGRPEPGLRRGGWRTFAEARAGDGDD